MLGLSHVALQMALCSAAANLPGDAVIPIHVRMAYRVGEPEFDKTYKIATDDGTSAFAEFDIRQGQYLLIVEAPTLHCGAAKFVSVLKDQNRKIVLALVPSPLPKMRPQYLMEGTAPISFLYTKPTYVLIDKSVACNTSVVAPKPAQIDYEYDQGAYYLWMYGDPAIAEQSPTLALRLRTPTGLAHYVRINVPYVDAMNPGWPGSLRLDVTEDMIDGLATEKTDVLLCPKMWETSVGGA
jgi:hypothetical protein